MMQAQGMKKLIHHASINFLWTHFLVTITVIIVPSTYGATVVSATDFYVLQMPPLQIMYTTKAINKQTNKQTKQTTV